MNFMAFVKRPLDLVGIYNKQFQAAIILNGLRLTGYMYLVDEILSSYQGDKYTGPSAWNRDNTSR